MTEKLATYTLSQVEIDAINKLRQAASKHSTKMSNKYSTFDETMHVSIMSWTKEESRRLVKTVEAKETRKIEAVKKAINESKAELLDKLADAIQRNDKKAQNELTAEIAKQSKK